jgi:cytochrome c553
MARFATPARILVILVAGLAGVFAAAALFAWSGVYSVAASRGHWALVSWFLDFSMRSSVRTHAFAIEVPALDDPNLVRLGAAHFHGGCAYCHGAPGIPLNPIAEQMLPPPPPLTQVVPSWKANELFWIVKHGIKYTGMPGWVAQERDDEAWAVVAFLRQLPGLDAGRYRELALGQVDIAPTTGQELAKAESNPQAQGACARCHGSGEAGPTSNLVPVLHGQAVEYLSAALQAYASGRRTSGIMQPIASDLDARSMRLLAGYYSRLPPPRLQFPPTHAEAAAINRGRALATDGVAKEGIPPCAACHEGAAQPGFPRLRGQPARYLVRQLELWRRGLNTQTANAAIMAPIARRLTEPQIEDVSAYYASLARAPDSGESRR